MGRASVRVCAFAVAALCLASGPAGAEEDFYKGKTISIIAGFAPGGGYDLYARLLGRHIGDHIPGRPSVVVQNMDGAGSVRASNHVYVNAPKDGTVIAAVNQNMPMYQMLGGKAAQFDAAKFRWLGSMASSNSLLYTWHTSTAKTLDDAKKREVILGGTGTNSDSHIYPTLVNNLLGTKFKMVHGYTSGGKEVHIAIERGEVEGRGGNTWASLLSSNRAWIDEKKLNFLVQIGFEPEPELKHVPLLIDLVKTEEEKQIVTVVTLPTFIGYAHWVSPGVPAERVELLRAAYDATMKDPAFVADAQKSGVLLKVQSGKQIEALVQRAAATPRPIIEKTARLLEWKD
jgi:tripartite-type tricarboxylate transporter receptor subunit TctC